MSATDKSDTKPYWANYGTCVDIFAPGVSVTSAWYTSNTATNTISGTSMAAPHVTGAAALYLQSNPSATPAQVATAVTSNATANQIVSAGTGTPNKLLYTGFIGPTPPASDKPPVARFTWSCGAPHFCRFDSSTSTDDHGIASRTWKWGDGKAITSTTAREEHYYARAGTYTVTLTVTDTGGQKGSTSHTIKVP